MSDMEGYINKLNRYLPVDFDDQENSEYRRYMINTFIENCNHEKYQFALMAFHMLFMTFLYTEFWQLKTFSYNKVERLCRNQRCFDEINNVFDSSMIPEKDFIQHTLRNLGMHPNIANKPKQFVDTRDDCAHASGIIQYDDIATKRYFEEVLEYAERIAQANKDNILFIFNEKLSEYFNSVSFDTTITVDFMKLKISELKLSCRDLEYILIQSEPEYINNQKNKQIAYYFAMVLLQDMYYSISSEEVHIDISDSYYIDKTITSIDSLTEEEFTDMQIQIEDEYYFLKDNVSVLDIRKIEDSIKIRIN